MIHTAIDPWLTRAIAAIDDQAQLLLCEDLPVIRVVPNSPRGRPPLGFPGHLSVNADPATRAPRRFGRSTPAGNPEANATQNLPTFEAGNLEQTPESSTNTSEDQNCKDESKHKELGPRRHEYSRDEKSGNSRSDGSIRAPDQVLAVCHRRRYYRALRRRVRASA